MIPLTWDGARPSLFFKAPQVILMCHQGGESLTQFLVWLQAAQTTSALEPSLVGLCSQEIESESGFGFPKAQKDIVNSVLKSWLLSCIFYSLSRQRVPFITSPLLLNE